MYTAQYPLYSQKLYKCWNTFNRLPSMYKMYFYLVQQMHYIWFMSLYQVVWRCEFLLVCATQEDRKNRQICPHKTIPKQRTAEAADRLRWALNLLCRKRSCVTNNDVELFSPLEGRATWQFRGKRWSVGLNLLGQLISRRSQVHFPSSGAHDIFLQCGGQERKKRTTGAHLRSRLNTQCCQSRSESRKKVRCDAEMGKLYTGYRLLIKR